ncbi:MAG: hypothetical protein MZU97_26780 [Bacillus subtilis]|nr:hypothetical protein [Bacillus subtilis]
METSLTPSLGIRVHFENIEIKHSDNTEFISNRQCFSGNSAFALNRQRSCNKANPHK